MKEVGTWALTLTEYKRQIVKFTLEQVLLKHYQSVRPATPRMTSQHGDDLSSTSKKSL